WTIDDLADTPDDGNRYEIFDGSLLVSPAPHVPHAKAVLRLRRLIEAHKPAHIEVAENIGLQVRAGRSYFIPDLIVVLVSALDRSDGAFNSPHAPLVVEVMSKGNSKIDLDEAARIRSRCHPAVLDRQQGRPDFDRSDAARAGQGLPGPGCR